MFAFWNGCSWLECDMDDGVEIWLRCQFFSFPTVGFRLVSIFHNSDKKIATITVINVTANIEWRNCVKYAWYLWMKTKTSNSDIDDEVDDNTNGLLVYQTTSRPQKTMIMMMEIYVGRTLWLKQSKRDSMSCEFYLLMFSELHAHCRLHTLVL